jgi:antitoxin component YwqK of YwqJK toxin-antitoxin module
MGKWDSVNKSRYENGQLKAIINFKNGKEDGKGIWFYKNGQFKGELLFNSGRLMEIVSLFDQTGRTLEKGTLKEGSGTVNNYTDDGKLEYIEYYKNGKVKKKITPKNQIP